MCGASWLRRGCAETPSGIQARLFDVPERFQLSDDPGIEYSVLRRWKKQLTDDPQNAFPGKGKLKADDEELRRLKRELDRVKEERDILKKALAYFAEDQK